MTPLDFQATVEVDVSAYGRFHAFRLAGEMHRLGVLNRLYTSHPRAIDAVPHGRVTNVSWLKAAEFAAVRTTGRIIPQERVWGWFGRAYDLSISRRVRRRRASSRRPIFHAWASHSGRCLRAASATGCRTFLESSCPHPTFKIELLKEEAARVHEPFHPPASWVDAVSEECDIADRITVPSEYSRRSYIAAGYPAEKVVNIPLGVDVSEMAYQPRGRRDWTADTPFRVLMVGTNALRKGAHDLLQAWSMLRLPHAELILRCDVPRASAALLTSSGVRQIAPVSRERLVEMYRTADVFCFPSIDDGFGMVVLEAMAAGLPVVTTPHVGAAELMDDGVQGFVVPIRSPQALAARLEHLYRTPELVADMSAQAHRLASAFSWQRYAMSMLQPYES